MPARVHAIVVARAGASSRAHLLRTLEALAAQTRPVDAITLVHCGDAASVRESPAVARSVEGIIETKASSSFADALALAYPRIREGAAIWFLAQDTVPAPDALELLAGALERSPSASLAAPKLVQADSDGAIVSLGVSMTGLGRTVELASGELDQGQHDGAEDALGADIRGLLVRAEARDSLRVDRALGGADEGLDLGVRARLGGGRVVLAPTARVGVRPDGPAALPRRTAQRSYSTRRAQLHRRLVYAPAIALLPHWLSLLPLALWRSITHLIGKRPAAVLPEWGAALTAMVRLGDVARSRRRIRTTRTSSWSSIAPLRITHSQLRRHLDDGHGNEGGAVSELRFFSGGGAWAVLAAVVVSVASFTSLLAWPAIGGGALLPLRDTVAALWQDASWGMRGVGIDVVGPADPFAAVVAALGTLWPSTPSFALVLLWLLALPLAVLGGWFAATRVTDRSGLRVFAGIAWALSPTFLTALVQGRPAAVLLHLLLPWLLHAAVVAHRSWGAAGAASLLFAAVVACAPSLAPALVLLWLLALIVVLASRRVHGAVRLVWLLVPAAAVFAPLVLWQAQHDSLWALLGDPGLVWGGSGLTADPDGRALIAAGFPSADAAGWSAFVGTPVWAGVLALPLAALALGAAVAPRWRAGLTMLAVLLAGLATAFLAVGVFVSFDQGTPVAIWAGSGLSLAWAGLVGAALVTLDTAVTPPRLRATAAVAAALALAVCAVPALTALHRDASPLTNGPTSTLPALVEIEAAGDLDRATLVLTPRDDGGLAAQVVWGPSATLGAQTTLLSTATEPRGRDVSALAVDVLSARVFDASGELARLGVHFVLLGPGADDESDAARTFRLNAVTALDQRTGFVKVSDTGKGLLWRVEGTPSARDGLTAAQQGTAHLVLTIELIVLLTALLLALPTRASRRAARGRSRIVGRTPEERGSSSAARREPLPADAIPAAPPAAEPLPPAEESADGLSPAGLPSDGLPPEDPPTETPPSGDPSVEEERRAEETPVEDARREDPPVDADAPDAPDADVPADADPADADPEEQR